MPSMQEWKTHTQQLTQQVEQVLSQAKQQGAESAEVAVSSSTGLSCGVRMGEVEKIEFNQDQGFSVTVYLEGKQGSASTSDNSAKAIADTVAAACNIARYTSVDPCAGLAKAHEMATHVPDLDLYHPWDINPQQAIDKALEAEQVARQYSDKIINSEGASVDSGQSAYVYGNSHGFIGNYTGTLHGASCSVIAQDQGDMQRDYWYSCARNAMQLDSMAHLGTMAAQRTLARLNPKKIRTQQTPVIFCAEVANSLVAHFLAAISGASLYRKASFLLDQCGKSIFPDWVNIHESPRLQGYLGSAAFDQDGLATRSKHFIEQGILKQYILSTYSGRRLNLPSTANAGGVHNLQIDSNAESQEALLKQMGSGLLVTEMMGQGVNMVTGDYSRGAAGFWVEHGHIQYPVAEITLAGNLKDFFRQLVATGNDIDRRGTILTGSWLVDGVTVAGA